MTNLPDPKAQLIKRIVKLAPTLLVATDREVQAIASAWLEDKATHLQKMRDQFAVWLMEPEDKDEVKLSNVVAYFDTEISALANKSKEQ